MKIPPFLPAAAILFWGWQTGVWSIAVPVAVIVAAAQFVPLRWEFSNALLYRVADFCTVLIALLAGYLYFTYGNPRAIVLLFEWLPVALLPLALAHAYGTAERMDLGVLFWSLRRNPPREPLSFDPSFPYFAVWLIAASAANVRSEWFYLGVTLLTAWPLVSMRPLSYRVGTWAAAFSCAVALGYGVQYGLREAQLWLEGAAPDWIAGMGSRTNPYQSVTDIGHIGALKQSNAIVLRVTAEGPHKPPRLLYRASYNVFGGASWIARAAPFQAVPPGQRFQNWTLLPGQSPGARVMIHDYSARPDPVLSLPGGTVEVAQLEARAVNRNRLGAVQIDRTPGFFTYVASFVPGRILEDPPVADDLRIPRVDRPEFSRLAAELGLGTLPTPAALEKVRDFFRQHFRYATFQERPSHGVSPTVDFIRRSRAGHCEYFATATVLLLRAAGIPSRYATGFAVQEYSSLEQAYLVRERHAHSWAIAYVNGAWRDVDTTPPDWFGIEARAAPVWTGVRDVLSWLRFQVAQAWASSDNYTLALVAIVVALPYGLWLGWRLYRTRRTAEKKVPDGRGGFSAGPGGDSEFYEIERHIGKQGWGRRPDETAMDWLRRLRADAGVESKALREIVALHYRYRFDPAGLADSDRLKLRELATAWLERHRADGGSAGRLRS